MKSKTKYRLFILFCLGLDLIAMGWAGYRYINRKVPDEIKVEKGRNEDIQSLLKIPFLSFDDALTVSGEGSYMLRCSILGLLPFKEIKVTPADTTNVLVSGSTVGIYMETNGVLIIDTGEILSENGVPQDPARNIVKPGDYIVAFNQQEVSTKKELIRDLEELDGGEVTLQVNRNGEVIPVSLTPVRDSGGNYKLGIWVRDDTQGIGTLTYVDSMGNFGALGHGISDVDTGELLHIHTGELYRAEILGIQKGSSGNPGELSGLIRYSDRNIIGEIRQNSGNGIFGQFHLGDSSGIALREMPVGYKQELKTGPAQILSCVGDQVKEYQAEITRIDLNHEDTNKSFVIHVTDPELIRETGGIVQGMSGSPVIQNGKFMGAITHVFVQDSTTGYGIFAETMLGESGGSQG